MDTFATLVLAHLIADFPLQTNRVYTLKTRGNFGILLHASIHVAVTALFLKAPAQEWRVLAYLGTTHFLIDWTKLRILARHQTPGFLLDQAAHLMSLLFLTTVSGSIEIVEIPSMILYTAVVFAAVPAVSMVLWVLANDLVLQDRELRYFPVEWAQEQMMVVSKRSGFLMMVGFIGTALIFTAA